ncbi:hypothetical protein [Ciceribacter thiooxidans]|uniref:Uncharacterized protein n=1 Tax=Ciceribacter thiooxidans TaxID=1969821 RepID=A0ABV7HWU1_9HYPH|nr:hypothetical protein [Ciceribacter thiooxidans]
MRSLLVGWFVSLAAASSSHLVPGGNAHANDWGCQVILCLSNPGGATQFAECRPPVERLWRELAQGHSFPTCTGVGFWASGPGYEPLYCDEGYRLSLRFGGRGREASCVSTAPQVVTGPECSPGRDHSQLIIARRAGDRERTCRRYVTRQPHLRSKPHYIDVTIDGIGRQRVWY